VSEKLYNSCIKALKTIKFFSMNFYKCIYVIREVFNITKFIFKLEMRRVVSGK